MKLVVIRKQSSSSGLFKGPKFTYSLSVKANIAENEERLLDKYGLFSESFLFDPESDHDGDDKYDATGPYKISIKQLKEGVVWTCSGGIPLYFGNIPYAIQSLINDFLGIARARERWGGEEVIEIPFDNYVTE